MATNLIDMFNNTVGEILLKQASSILGESSENTSSAISAIVPSLLRALIQKGGSATGSANLMNYMAENNLDGSVLSNAHNLLGGGFETEKLMYSGAGIVKYLFDDNIYPLVDSISGGSSLKTSSATALLKLVAPFVMGILGKHIQEKGLDGPGLSNLLTGQNEFIKAGLNNKFGLNSGLPSNATGPVDKSSAKIQKEAQSSFSKVLPWLVLGLTALGLFYFVQKGCSSHPIAPADTNETQKDSIATTPSPEESNPLKTYTLPGGNKLSVLPGSFTGKLAEFLNSTEEGERCIAFDKVSFESGSFKIAAGSEMQLIQLATLLKAYPEIMVSIEGHTDDAGDDGKNKSLSKERAKVIKTWLTGQAIESGRLDVKGWGEDKPIATNKTAAGRERNRRVEICVTKK